MNISSLIMRTSPSKFKLEEIINEVIFIFNWDALINISG